MATKRKRGAPKYHIMILKNGSIDSRWTTLSSDFSPKDPLLVEAREKFGQGNIIIFDDFEMDSWYEDSEFYERKHWEDVVDMIHSKRG